jgi:hypothetical protein
MVKSYFFFLMFHLRKLLDRFQISLTEQVSVAVTLQTCNWELPGANLGQVKLPGSLQ